MSERDLVERLDDGYLTVAARGSDELDAEAAHAMKDAAAQLTRLRADVARLREALTGAVATITDYLEYSHDGDPWKEDARAMGEMDINEYGRDGRLNAARAALAGEAAR